jgi:ATP-dependent DNA helicase RecG
MELSIESMKRTVPEPRDDSKISPLVGAVLIRPDDKVKTAWRGQYRHGEHAEYTLFERECHNDILDGSILFTTLEPCTHISRAHGKLSCSERIVYARISEIWVGIEDPDPNVDRKGIAYLEEHGITVHMFDPDLQDIIYKENQKFIDQANERAAVAATTDEPGKTILSKLEEPIESATGRDLSNDALEEYRIRLNVGDSIRSTPFIDRLLHKRVLTKKDGQLIPTGFGILLFNDKPRDFLPQAGLLATIEYSDGKLEKFDFDAPLILIPKLFENWLKERLPVIMDRSQMKREELINSYPFTLVREALVNALVHRDYDIVGTKCQIFIKKDTIIIKSPGMPVRQITIKQLQEFDAPTISRNPLLHNVFGQMGLAEERGLGLKSFKDAAEKYHLPLPQYKFENPYLVLTIYTSQESAVGMLSQEILDSLNGDEINGWKLITSRSSITMSEYAKIMGFDKRKAQRHLKKFVELNILHRIGEGPSTEYRIK